MSSSNKAWKLVAAALGFCAVVACGASGRDPDAFVDVPMPDPGGGPPPPGDGFSEAGPCANGAATSITGVVYDPAGKTPLYNARVYVPSKPLEPFAEGLVCDRCGDPVSGAPYSTALSGPDGKFRLEGVPFGDKIPLVVQIGRWRRQVEIPHVERCKENALGDHELTRLPRSRKEGDLPRIAVVTGAKDALECTILRLGVDPSEIHLFRSTASTGGARLDGVSPSDMEKGKDLYVPRAGKNSRLFDYDAALFDCEDGEGPDTKDAADKEELVRYANAGGRVFTSHKSGNAWIEHGAAPFSDTASWGISCCGETASVNTSFPKGKAFADWLYAVHASPKVGELPMVEPLRSVAGVKGGSQAWLTIPDNGNVVEYAFNTPVGEPAEKQCGRVVFSNFHVIKSTEDYAAGTATDRSFPSGCSKRDLSENELALAFLFFDLGSCIQDDTRPPTVPR